MNSTYDRIDKIIRHHAYDCESTVTNDDIEYMIDEFYTDGELSTSECIQLHSELK